MTEPKHFSVKIRPLFVMRHWISIGVNTKKFFLNHLINETSLHVVDFISERPFI